MYIYIIIQDVDKLMNKINATIHHNRLKVSALDFYVALGALIAIILGVNFYS